MKMMLSEIARAIGAKFNNEKYKDVEITEVQFDSRKITERALFVPLIGERDGHDFLESARVSGACATLWQSDHELPQVKFPVLEVDDTLKAMQLLAQYYLNKVNPKVVAVTGSNGKTTTKDMIAAVLKQEFNVHATKGNFNNEIGVPFTILQMKMNTEVLVIEMGMDRPGQLTLLSKMVEPDIAVITMIGEAHIEFFGTRAKIAEAKMEIVSHLKDDGLLIYNGDEPLLRNLAKSLKQDTKTFGFNSDNDVIASDIHSYQYHASFKINVSDDKFSIPLIGSHNVANALAAVLVGEHYHEQLPTINHALQKFKATENRMQWKKGDVGEDILDDIYNSNPTAAAAVLKSFSAVPRRKNGKRIIVLADMLELGERGPEFHAELANGINPTQIDEVFMYGTLMENLANKLTEKFAPEKLHLYHVDQQAQLINQLKDTIHTDDIVLLKGSHSMKLDHVLAAIL